MSVWLFQMKNSDHFDTLLLWDGSHTYWSDEMIGSGGYKKMKTRWDKLINSRFVYIGEL